MARTISTITASILLLLTAASDYSHWSDSFEYSSLTDWLYSWDSSDLTSYSSDDFWDEWTWSGGSWDTAIEGWSSWDDSWSLMDEHTINWNSWSDTHHWAQFDWSDWGDWNLWDWSTWDIDSDWEVFGFEEYFWHNNIDFPSPTGDYGGGLLPFDEVELLNIQQYWTDNEDLNWCKDNWWPERVEDPDWAKMIQEFLISGNITNWCVFPGQVMVISDLRNLNLNDPNALPRIFKEIEGHCTESMCRRQLENRRRLNPGQFVERVWKLIAIYKQFGCPECFCDSKEKKELETVMAITKDHLKKNEFLSFNTTVETPEEVQAYFEELKEDLGLLSLDLPDEKTYIPLLDMDQAIEGPGQNAVQINKISELQHGIYEFCGK